MSGVRRLLIKKPSVELRKPKVNISSNPEGAGNTGTSACERKRLDAGKETNLKMKYEEVLFRKNSFLPLRRALKKGLIAELSRDFRLWTLKFLFMTARVTRETLRRSLSKLRHP